MITLLHGFLFPIAIGPEDAREPNIQNNLKQKFKF